MFFNSYNISNTPNEDDEREFLYDQDEETCELDTDDKGENGPAVRALLLITLVALLSSGCVPIETTTKRDFRDNYPHLLTNPFLRHRLPFVHSLRFRSTTRHHHHRRSH